MIKILVLGNSFSQDATYYLHQIASADNVELKVVNLYFGGCSLKQHWDNIETDSKTYTYEENGKHTDRKISISEAITLEKWDFVVTQQASYDSGLIDTYYPYIEKIVNYIKQKAPQAEFLLQETWAYDIDCLHECFVNYHHNQRFMYEQLSTCYKNVAKNLNVRLIPCGDIVEILRMQQYFNYGHGGMSICRDGFHMNVIYGRYLLSAIWYRFILRKSIISNNYIPHTELAPNVVCDLNLLNIIKNIVDEAILF